MWVVSNGFEILYCLADSMEIAIFHDRRTKIKAGEFFAQMLLCKSYIFRQGLCSLSTWPELPQVINGHQVPQDRWQERFDSMGFTLQ